MIIVGWLFAVSAGVIGNEAGERQQQPLPAL
jgi:hypothetical protein